MSLTAAIARDALADSSARTSRNASGDRIGWDDGFVLRSSDDSFLVRINSLIGIDASQFAAAADASTYSLAGTGVPDGGEQLLVRRPAAGHVLSGSRKRRRPARGRASELGN